VAYFYAKYLSDKLFGDYSDQTHLEIDDVLDMMLLYRQTILPILGSVYDLVRVGINMSFIFLSLDS